MIADVFDSTIQRYMDGVLDGSIVASRAVINCVERQVRDLKRQSTAEFPYHFDAAHAAKVCRFYPSVLKHSIGRYAGMAFELEPWQMFCEAVIFGWKRDVDETRRFRRAYESVARKNGKSTRAAGRAIFMARYDHNPVAASRLGKVFVPEPVSQVVLCATKKEQAQKVIYLEIERMRRKSQAVKRSSSDVNKEIYFPDNDGCIMCVGSDKPYDGLNPHAIMMDEIHAWCEHHRPFYDTMITGSGARDQSLISYLTTAGTNKSYLWVEVYEYCKKVLSGVIQDESIFAYIAELDDGDDPFDEANWLKANPNLGVSVSVEYLRDMAREMRETPVGVQRFTRFHGNRIVSSNAQAFDLDKWDACESELSDWGTADCITAAADLGGMDDLGSYAMVARFPIGEDDDKPIYRYEARVKGYISSETTRNLEREPFSGFIFDGILKRELYPVTVLRDDMLDDCEQYGIDQVGLDPHGAILFSEDVKKRGLVAVRIGQNCGWFSGPIKDLHRAIEEGRFKHDGNPLLRWAVSNAILYIAKNGDCMYDKSASSEKIDPVVALTMAFRLCQVAPARPSGSLFIN